ncbi:MAG TPA: riboflavin synthase [Acidobacteriota bacterium]|nr:riboflavin synthase [Acidobacteriota bacterium]
MFTGIIEETGRIEALRSGNRGTAIRIAADSIPLTLTIGDSIAVNGVCLTTTAVGNITFECDLSPETQRRTSLSRAREGTLVNLERPLTVASRLGGHFVLGHVDGMGELLSSKPAGDGVELAFSFPRDLDRYLVFKGSIAVDGISLTIASLEETSFVVAVIPHTLQNTNLKTLRIGDHVNLEVDILGKYLERFCHLGLLEGRTTPGLSIEYLKEQGY